MNWLSTTKASEELGISREHLLQLRKDGSLKVRKHWRDVGRSCSMRPTYQWNIEQVQKWLETPPEKRM